MDATPAFDEWLAEQRTRSNGVVNLSRDVAGDKQWLAGAHSEAGLIYLVGRSAALDLTATLETANGCTTTALHDDSALVSLGLRRGSHGQSLVWREESGRALASRCRSSSS
jgi:hypothetical protein